MATQDQDYAHGKMDIEQQRKTFEGFLKLGFWSAVHVAVILILLAIFVA